MSGHVFLQSNGLTEVLQGVRDHFQGGGRVAPVVVVLLGLVLTLLVAYGLSRRQTRPAGGAGRADPQALFQRLLGKLELAAPQRQLLASMAQELRLENPAVILLSPALLDRYLDVWQTRPSSPPARPTGANREGFAELIAQTRAALFPQEDRAEARRRSTEEPAGEAV